MLKAFGSNHLYGQQYGQSKPKVLFLHGWQRSSKDFNKIAESLYNDYGISSIALDLPGFGASGYEFDGLLDEKFTAGSFDYAKKVADAIGGEFDDFVVLGHSFGGRVAIFLQSMLQDKIKGMVLTGVPIVADPTRSKVKPNRVLKTYKILNSIKLIPDSKVEELKMRYGSTDYKNATGKVRDTLVKVIAETNADLYISELKKSNCKIILAWGQNDTEIVIEVAERVIAEFPGRNITLIDIKGCGHMAPLEKPDEFVTIVADLVTNSLQNR